MYMAAAVELARKAAALGDVPVGCVIVRGGEIIAWGKNTKEIAKNAVCHAEINAISEACEKLKSFRLSDCALYVTMEPCPMCAGAIISARIPQIYYGCRDENFGSCGSVINLFMERYGHHPKIVGGICEEQSKEILEEFFGRLRR